MTQARRVLVIDDQLCDLEWLLDLVKARGHEVVVATNEKEARARLDGVKAGRESYALAIVDVMMAIADITELAEIDDKFFADSRDSGIRLCRYARQELGLNQAALPLVCLTAREDEDVKEAMRALDIPIFNRASASPQRSIRAYLERALATTPNA